LRKLKETILSSTSSILNLTVASDGYFMSDVDNKFDACVAKSCQND